MLHVEVFHLYSSLATTIYLSLIVSVSWPLGDPFIVVDPLFHFRNTSHTRTINLLCLTNLKLTFNLANQETNIGGHRITLNFL
jgi:hypothetical protein